MRKTRAHPPKDRKVEDLRHYRRVIRDAVRALDECEAPRWSGGIELELAGRIRLLNSNHVIAENLLRGALHASSSVPLDRSASSGAAGPSTAMGTSPAQREIAAEAPRRLDGGRHAVRPPS
jgi:hypothetical protein